MKAVGGLNKSDSVELRYVGTRLEWIEEQVEDEDVEKIFVENLSNFAMTGSSVRGLWSGTRSFLLVFLRIDDFHQYASMILER